MKILVEVSDDKELCKDCQFLYRIDPHCQLGASQEAFCEVFGDLKQEGTGMVGERIYRANGCIESEHPD